MRRRGGLASRLSRRENDDSPGSGCSARHAGIADPFFVRLRVLKIEAEGTKLDDGGREVKNEFRKTASQRWVSPGTGTRLRIKKATGGRMLRSLCSAASFES